MNILTSDLARMKQLLDRKSIDAERDRRQSPFLTMFSEAGPGRRELYPKQIEFFGAGLQYKERLFMAANRVGKTVAGGFEATCHLTAAIRFGGKAGDLTVPPMDGPAAPPVRPRATWCKVCCWESRAAKD